MDVIVSIVGGGRSRSASAAVKTRDIPEHVSLALVDCVKTPAEQFSIALDGTSPISSTTP